MAKAEFTASLLQITSVSHDLLEIILKCLFGNIYYYWLYKCIYSVIQTHFSSKEQHEIEMFCRSLK